jgi:hypothetical protein
MNKSISRTQVNTFGRLLPRVGALLIIGSLIYGLGVPLTASGKTEKVTICHVAGHEGTDKYVTLTLAYPAVYGNGGHFNENGTTRAGHEGDYLGACDVEIPTSTTAAETTSTTAPETTTTAAETSTTIAPETTSTTVAANTTTTAAETTTTTTIAPETTTTTAAETTTTTAAETSTTIAPETTSTTVAANTTTTAAEASTTIAPETTTTTTTDEDVDAIVVGTDTDLVDPVTTETTTDDSSEQGGSDPVVVAAETLPYTGINGSLLMPAVFMLIAGVMLVAFTNRVGQTVGAHTSAARFRLRLHRGRHESRNS